MQSPFAVQGSIFTGFRIRHRHLLGAIFCGSAGKKIHLLCGKPGLDPWVGKILWRRERLPTPVFWSREFRGLYSPWGHKESDTTERLSLSPKTYCFKQYRKQLVGLRTFQNRNIFSSGSTNMSHLDEQEIFTDVKNIE